MINSLLDTDFYKLSMQQAAFFHPGGNKIARYRLVCRSGEDLSSLKEEIEQALYSFKKLKFLDEEIQYLKENYPILKEEYLNFIKNLDLSVINNEVKVENGQLAIYPSGPWHTAILCEVPYLAIVQEVYWKHWLKKNNINETAFFKKGKDQLEKNIKFVNENEINFMEFGSRRRFSQKWHKEVTETFAKKIESKNFLGTSNILIAKNLPAPYNIAKGTMAHEFFQAFQALSNLKDSQIEALKFWKKIYGDNLNVALTDIFGMKAFLKDIKLGGLIDEYSGFRHDSGSASQWGHDLLDFFKKHRPNKKIYGVFSDGLNFNQKTVDIKNEFKDKMSTVSFGIGTASTNDFQGAFGHKALSLVMKLDSLDGIKTIKISDEPGKVTCTSDELINKTFKMIDEKIGGQDDK